MATNLLAQQPNPSGNAQSLPSFTGPSRNPYWNSVGSITQVSSEIPVGVTDRPARATRNAAPLLRDSLYAERSLLCALALG
jgi:hypothetical protein